jgi:hypothetical protein
MQDRTARPCGGFVLLERLLASGVVTIEDIEKGTSHEPLNRN